MDAWLTPDIEQIQEPQVCRSISVPAALLHYVTGALEMLTEERNWEEFGTSSVEAVTQLFMNVLDDYQGSVCGMKFVPNQGYQLFYENHIAFGGYQIVINQNNMPEYIVNPTALLCAMEVIFESPNKELIVSDSSGNALQRFRVTTANLLHKFSVIAPMGASGFAMSTNEDTGKSVTWRCKIVGWL